ncbi:excinuclease ABC subunit UvrC [Candidatus Peregrinibacteria bacterium]|nr:excinuclease ABC subunit UvrC [Candidatus Peregrinibacteria bacterium]
MDKNKINRLIKSIPRNSGVYKMKNSSGKIIYVGKAKDLHDRVSQYFQDDPIRSERAKKMISEIENIEYIETPTELEAIFLETNLIKELKPRYNIRLRDDKNFVYIRIDIAEDFPKITLVRKPLKDKALYLGPKTAAHKIKTTLRILKKILPFRHCNLKIEYLGGTHAAARQAGESSVRVSNKTIKFPCLDYHIKKCPGPCIGKCTKEEYRENIDKIIKFFKGNSSEIVKDLENEMRSAASDHKFEKAAKIRDKMKDIEEITAKQYITNLPLIDADAINYVIDNNKIFASIFQIREGKIIGQENLAFDAIANPPASEIIDALLKSYYEKTSSIPAQILLPIEPEDIQLAEKWLKMGSDLKNAKMGPCPKIVVPQAGTNSRLLELALLNARSFANQSKARWMHEQGVEEGLEELSQILSIPRPARRIECYDVSHLGGTETVGSMIVFIDGIANPNFYRRFKLSQKTPDDYASMKELLERRLSRLARQTLPRDFTLHKALKKQTSLIKQKIKEANLAVGTFSRKDFFIITKGKKFAGMIGLVKHNQTYRTIGLYVEPKFRGHKLSYFLLEKAVQQAKSKRVYIICRKTLKEHYEEFGFEEIKQLPSDLYNIENCTTDCPIEGMIALVYDKTRHTADKSFTSKPDLILVDGGKPQLTAGIKVLNALSLKIPIAALAKQNEEVYTPNSPKPIIFAPESHTLKLLQRIRDEAHRFAITFMKNRHGSQMIKSELTQIPGIAEKTMQKLLRTFGSLENLKNTPMDKIAEIAGKSAAIKIKQHFQSPPS